MPDSSKRIIVDGVDFASVFQFHRILRAIAMAMQPPRLIIALLMVTALATAGHLWDAFDTPTINPKGFLWGPIKETEKNLAQNVLRQQLVRRGLEAPSDREVELDPRDVLTQVRTKLLADVADGSKTREEAEDLYLQIAVLIETIRPRGTFEACTNYVTKSFHRTLNGVISANPRGAMVGLYGLLVRTPVALWQRDKPFAVFYGLFFVFVIALGGGALARMVACEVATGERLRIRDAVDFALESWPRLLLTPLLPLLIVAALCLVLAVLGAVGFLPWLDVIGGVLYVIALIVGFIVAFLVIGYAAGFSLLIPAVACENCDAADAQQRGYAYVLSRPFHAVGYFITALLGMTIGYLFVTFVALVILTVTTAMLSMWNSNPAIKAGAGERIMLENLRLIAQDDWLKIYKPSAIGDDADDPSELVFEATHRLPAGESHQRLAASGVTFWQNFVSSLVASYVFAYFFAAATLVYLLLRKKCDGQDPTEIWRAGMIPGTITRLPADEPENTSGE